MQGEWQRVSKIAFWSWVVFYALFLIHAATNKSGFLIVDSANLIMHEAGHLLFSHFGRTLGLWGGTLFQLMVPAMLASYFSFHRQTTGFVFCAFFFFENFLNISVYMADARAQVLPLVTVGNPDQAGHDWFNIFSSLGLLRHDLGIARVFRLLGWTGMFGTIGWFAWHVRTAQRAETGTNHS